MVTAFFGDSLNSSTNFCMNTKLYEAKCLFLAQPPIILHVMSDVVIVIQESLSYVAGTQYFFKQISAKKTELCLSCIKFW